MITGLEDVKEVPMGSLFNALDEKTIKYKVTNSNPGSIQHVFENGQLSMRGLSYGNSTITVTAEDAYDNKATQIFLVDVVENTTATLNGIYDGVIYAGEQLYKIPLTQVYGEVVNVYNGVDYNVSVTYPEQTTPTIEDSHTETNDNTKVASVFGLNNMRIASLGAGMNFAASTLSSNSAIDQYIATLPNDAAIVVETPI
jgi:hypothetical protein